MSKITVSQFNCLQDNFGFIIHDKDTGETVAVDAPDGEVVSTQLQISGWNLTHIFTTHHHSDHVNGNHLLKERFGCQIIGPKLEASKIPGLDIAVSGGDKFIWAKREIIIYPCPGHTAGQIAYFIPSIDSLFVGDTIFAMGCGRVLEGTIEQMYQSVNQFKSLPRETKIYFGHEYTKMNCKFALTLEPGNNALQSRSTVIAANVARADMTCPTTLGDELQTNPFMRCHSSEIRQTLGMQDASDIEVFTKLREMRNSFKLLNI